MALLALLMALSGATRSATAPSGKAFSWGDNEYGQLGNGNTGTDTNTPGAVKDLTGLKSVKAGCYHGLALLENGAVRSWGDNDDGSDVPVKVKNLTNVKNIDGGYEFTLAATE